MKACLALLLPAVFLVGGATLCEEVLLSRVLGRLLGSTLSSQAVVLGGFLGGMALGGWLGEKALQRRGGRTRVGELWGWGLTALLSGAGTLLLVAILAFFQGLDTIPAGVGVVAVACIALVAIPAGAGFPLAVAALGACPSPRLVGVVYGLGALGGTVGALGTPFYFLPILGERNSLFVCAGLLLVLGGGVMKFTRTSGSASRPSPDVKMERGSSASPDFSAPPVGATLLATVGFSGLAVVYLEMVWTRILVLVVGSSVYAFAVVTAGVVLGIGLGSILLAPVAGRGRGSLVVSLLVLLFLGAVYFVVPRLPDAYLLGARTFGPSPAMGALGAGVVVLFACAPLGLIFPAVVGRVPARAGSLAAANGLGALVGAVLGAGAGGIGIEGSYILGLAAVAAVAVCCLFLAPLRGRLIPLLITVALPVGPVVFCLGWGWDLDRLLTGVYQWPRDALMNRELDSEGRQVLDIQEGREAIVSVEKIVSPDGKMATVYIKANGKVEGSVPAESGTPSLADLPTQVLLGTLPALLVEGRRAAVIGLGGGTTLGAAHRSGLAPIDLLEIEPAFKKAILGPRSFRYFEPYLGGALESPEVTLWFGDARALIAGPLSQRRWDAVVSQPSEPWIAASAPLFTAEFFSRSSRRLSDGGVFLQWVQLYKLPLPTLKILVRTFRTAFERVYILRPPGTGELILVGARRPLDFPGLLRRGDSLDRSVPGILSECGLETRLDLLAMFLLGPEGVDGWVGTSPELPRNRDDRNLLEITAPALLHGGGEHAVANLRAIQRLGEGDPLSRYLPPALRTPQILRDLAARNIHLGDFWEALALLDGDGSTEAAALRARAQREIEATTSADSRGASP